MNEKPFEEKMSELKNKHAGSHPEAIRMLEHWEERYVKLKAIIVTGKQIGRAHV